MAHVVKLSDVKKEIDGLSKKAGTIQVEDGHNMLASILRDVKALKAKCEYLEEKISYAKTRAEKRKANASAPRKEAPKAQDTQAKEAKVAE